MYVIFGIRGILRCVEMNQINDTNLRYFTVPRYFVEMRRLLKGPGNLIIDIVTTVEQGVITFPI